MKKILYIIFSIFIITDIFSLNIKTPIKKLVFMEYFNSFDSIYSISKNNNLIKDEFKKHNILYPKDKKLWSHIWQTVKNVDEFKELSDKDKKNLRIIMFFHDIGKVYSIKNHEFISASICSEILTGLGFNDDYILFICKMIEYHSDYGYFPRINHNLELLTDKEINIIYYVSMCDILTRKEFDTKNNKLKIKELKNKLLSRNKKDIYNYTNILNSIYFTIRNHPLYKSLHMFKLNIYILKDFLFTFRNNEKCILIFDDILQSV